MINLTISEQFQYEEIGDGVFAAFAKPTGGSVSNAGVVDIGDELVVFDSFLSPVAAQQLRTIAESRAGKPVRYLVNSHHHLDHVGGNPVFAESCNIISSVKTHEMLVTSTEIDDCQQNARIQLEAFIASSTSAKNAKAPQFAAEIRYYEAVIAALPTLKLIPASIRFENRMVIEGSKRSIEIINYGGGHSLSDSILYVPDSKLIFTGDLLTVGQHPYLADGDPGDLDRILNQVSGLSPHYLIPGHGPIAELDDIRVQRQYITMLTEIAMREIVYGATDGNDALQRASKLPIPPNFANWEFASHFHVNLLFLYRRLLAAYAD